MIKTFKSLSLQLLLLIQQSTSSSNGSKKHLCFQPYDKPGKTKASNKYYQGDSFKVEHVFDSHISSSSTTELNCNETLHNKKEEPKDFTNFDNGLDHIPSNLKNKKNSKKTKQGHNAPFSLDSKEKTNPSNSSEVASEIKPNPSNNNEKSSKPLFTIGGKPLILKTKANEKNSKSESPSFSNNVKNCDEQNSEPAEICESDISPDDTASESEYILVPKVKKLLEVYLAYNQTVFQDQKISANFPFQLSKESKNINKGDFFFDVSAIERLENERNFENFCQTVIGNATTSEFTVQQICNFYIPYNIFQQKTKHLRNSFNLYNLNVNDIVINKYDQNNDRLLSMSELEWQEVDDIVDNFIISPASFNSIDITQIFQVQVVFNTLKDFLSLNENCKKAFQVKNAKALWNCLENLLKESCDPRSVKKHDENMNEIKTEEKVFNKPSESKQDKNTSFLGKMVSSSDDNNNYLLVDSDTFENVSEETFKIDYDEPIDETSSFLFYIQYICEFVESNFPLDNEIAFNEYSPRILFLKFVKICTIIYEAIYGTERIVDRHALINNENFDNLIRNSTAIKNLSDKLEGELINFMAQYRYIYNHFFNNYLKSYSNETMDSIEKFRIAIILCDSIMHMLTLVCNFRNIYLNLPLKAYQLNLNFIENSNKCQFKSIDMEGLIFKKLSFEDTGIERASSESAHVFENVFISFAKLLQLPINFVKKDTNSVNCCVEDFVKLKREYTRTNYYKNNPKRELKINEFVKVGTAYISHALKFKNITTIGPNMWIERYSCALYDYLKNLDFMKNIDGSDLEMPGLPQCVQN